jgi:multicomponent K+:H+ antiporter subunit D
VLAVTAEAFALDAEESEPQEEVGIVIPAAMAFLALSFLGCGLLVAGLPPLPGFLAKFAIMSALLQEEARGAVTWTVVALLLLSGLAATIAFARAGVRIFWATERIAPTVRLVEMAPVAALLALCVALCVLAAPAMAYLEEAAQALHVPRGYIEEVLSK